MKQRVYFETNIVSYLTSRPSRDMVIAAHQELTRQWWETRASSFDLLVSELVREEAAKGDEKASGKRLLAIETVPILVTSEAALSLAEQLVSTGPIPREYAASDRNTAGPGPGKSCSKHQTKIGPRFWRLSPGMRKIGAICSRGRKACSIRRKSYPGAPAPGRKSTS